MLAAKLYGKEDLRLVECPVPDIREDEILLRVKAAAVCGTDLRMIQNGSNGIDGNHPRTLGHEISGIIEKKGSLVSGYEEGMHICVAPNMGCGICDHCIEGNTHLCSQYQAFGINIDGGFAEYVRIPERAVSQGNLMILDESVNFSDAALLEPMSCVLNGQSRMKMNLNDTVLIVGAGPIGVMHALLARARGASRVFIRDLSEERMRQCKEVCREFVPMYGEDLKEEVMKQTGNKGIDVCIVACPSGRAQEEALELMSMNGRVLFFGGLPQGKDKVLLSSNLIHYKQLSIFGSTRANVAQYRSAAKMVEYGKLELSKVISREYTLDHIQEAVAYAKSAQGLKTVITF